MQYFLFHLQRLAYSSCSIDARSSDQQDQSARIALEL